MATCQQYGEVEGVSAIAITNQGLAGYKNAIQPYSETYYMSFTTITFRNKFAHSIEVALHVKGRSGHTLKKDVRNVC